MEDLRLYDEKFRLVCIVPRCVSVNWSITYNAIGTFEAHFEPGDAAMQTALERPFLVAVQGGLQAVVPAFQINAREGILYGRTCNWLLTGGVVPDFDTKSEILPANGDVETLARAYVAYALPWMQLGETAGFTKQIQFWRNTYNSLSDVVCDCLANDGGGHEVVFDRVSKRWVFRCLKGRELPLLLSEQSRTAYETEYTRDALEGYTGGWYQEEQPEDAEGNRPDAVWKYIALDGEKTGIYRRDCVLSASTQSEARSELAKKQAVQAIQAKTRNLKLGKDYQLGDVVRVQVAAGATRITQKKRIVGVNISYEAGACEEQPVLEESGNG